MFINLIIGNPGRCFFYSAWAEGNDQIDLEIKCAVLEKSETFNPKTDITALRRMAEEFENKMPRGPRLSSLEDSLLVEELDLLKKKVHHDHEALRVWKMKALGAESNAAAAIRMFEQDQHKNLADGADAYVAKHIIYVNWQDDVQDGSGSANTVIKACGEMRKNIAASLACQPHEVRMVGLLNWCAPATHPELHSKCELQVAGWILNEDSNNCALVHMPVHTHYHKKLILVENKATERLSKGTWNSDTQFVSFFKERVDARDERPLTYPGRMLLPGVLTEIRTSIWWGCTLREEGRVGPITQLKGKDMRVVEDLSDAALPAVDAYPKAGKKYEQLGRDHSQALIDGLMTGADLTSVKALLFVSLAAQVGDDVMGMVAHATSALASKPCYMVAVPEDVTAANWMDHEVKADIRSLLKAKKMLLVAGMSPILERPGDDQVVPYAPMPQFQCLVPVGGVVAKAPGVLKDGEVLPSAITLQMPLDTFKKWHRHRVHGQEFLGLVEEYKLDVVAEQEAQPQDNAKSGGEPGAELPEQPPNKKRRVSGGPGPGPGQKTGQRVDPKHLVDNTAITEALLCEVTLPTPKGTTVKLQHRVGGKFYIVNMGKSEVTLQQNTLLCGFGNGTFQLLKSEEVPAENMLEYQLESSNDLVVVNTAVQTLGDVFKAERQKNSTFSICYHKVVDEPTAEDPHKFVVKQTHRICVCLKKGDDVKLSQANFAGSCGQYDWSGSHCSQRRWQVRVTNKGLQVVAPRVYLTYDVHLAPGRACLILGGSA